MVAGSVFVEVRGPRSARFGGIGEKDCGLYPSVQIFTPSRLSPSAQSASWCISTNSRPMNSLLNLSFVILPLLASTQAAIIVVADGNLTSTNQLDRSTGGSSAAGITSTFTGSAADYSDGNGAHWGDTQFAYDAATGKTGTWIFSGLTIGAQYEVFATWIEQANRSRTAPYTVQSNALSVNQELAPVAGLSLTDATGTTRPFQLLTTATVNGAGQLVVTLSSPAATDADGGFVIADAIAIREVPEPSVLGLLGLSSLGLLSRRRRI